MDTTIHEYKTCSCWMCTDTRRALAEQAASVSRRMNRKQRRTVTAQLRKARHGQAK